MRQAPPSGHPDAFIERLTDCGSFPLKAAGIDILQINITHQCNLACKDCHIQAGPHRTETMSRATMKHCIQAAGNEKISAIGITVAPLKCIRTSSD